MPTRRDFLIAAAVCLGIPAAPVRAAEPARKPRRIGIVHVRGYGPQSLPALWSAFDAELGERGWVEGQNLVVERRESSGDRTQLPGLMAELIALDVEVICVYNAWSALAAKEATDRIPIVFIVGDAAGRGLVSNLARPERNLTGTSSQFVELQAKRVELLQLVSPGIKRVAALQIAQLGYPPAMFQGANRPRGVEVFIVELENRGDLARAMIRVSELKADAIVAAQYWPLAFQAELVGAVARQRLPAVFAERRYVELGGLLSFGSNYAADMRIQVAYVDKILRGAKPADLPVQQPQSFDMAINLRTAKALGVTFPSELLVRADLVIE